MKQLLVTLFLILLVNISSAQSGWGYVNYTAYKTHNGNGATKQIEKLNQEYDQKFDSIASLHSSDLQIYVSKRYGTK